MKARRKILPAGLPSQGRDAARPTRLRDARKGRRRTVPRSAMDRSRGIAPQLPAGVPQGVGHGIDWDTLPISMLLDSDFDMEDEEPILGHAKSMAFAIRDEEDGL